MKHNLTLLIIALITICLGSCQKWEKPSTPESVSILTEPQTNGESNKGGVRAVTIAATSQWTAVSDAGWLWVTPSSGGKGVQEVTINFTKNSTGQTRKGTVTFTSGDHSETFTLTQSR